MNLYCNIYISVHDKKTVLACAGALGAGQNKRAFARKYFTPLTLNPLPHATRGGEGI